MKLRGRSGGAAPRVQTVFAVAPGQSASLPNVASGRQALMQRLLEDIHAPAQRSVRCTSRDDRHRLGSARLLVLWWPAGVVGRSRRRGISRPPRRSGAVRVQRVRRDRNHVRCRQRVERRRRPTCRRGHGPQLVRRILRVRRDIPGLCPAKWPGPSDNRRVHRHCAGEKLRASVPGSRRWRSAGAAVLAAAGGCTRRSPGRRDAIPRLRQAA